MNNLNAVSPRIRAADLRKAYGTLQALDALSLTVYEGEAYGLVGPDGAGKSTALRLLAGVLAPDGGEISLMGHDLRQNPVQARAQLGYLSQQFSLYGDLTVAENLQFFGEVRDMSPQRRAERADQLLNFVGLTGVEDRLAGRLSGGMKQKLSLACALIHEPPILLLDEPTGGVDPVARQDFWQLIIRLLSEGLAVVVSTPYMDEAVRCQRVGFLYQGRLLTEGTPQQLIAQFNGSVLELTATPLKRARQVVMTLPGVVDALTFGESLHLFVHDVEETMKQLPPVLAEAGIVLSSLRPIPPTLEDLFISLLDRHNVMSSEVRP
ncbi:MAG: ABC transporter ATP-binding protein [Ardenticatenales bacterium]|nr:ABC transporter ATP-binding protein [Ardenticatenales bacterium]